MKIHTSVLTQAFIILATCLSQVGDVGATNRQCAHENYAYASSVRRLDNAQNRLYRMEQTYQTRVDQADYRMSLMSAQVEGARAQLSAIKTGGWGNGIACLFGGGNCIASSIRYATMQVARAQARVRAMEARYNAYANSLSRQLARFQDRIELIRADVAFRQSDVRNAEAALNACLASAQ